MRFDETLTIYQQMAFLYHYFIFCCEVDSKVNSPLPETRVAIINMHIIMN